MEGNKAAMPARVRRDRVRRHLQQKAKLLKLRQPDVLLSLIRHIL